MEYWICEEKKIQNQLNFIVSLKIQIISETINHWDIKILILTCINLVKHQFIVTL